MLQNLFIASGGNPLLLRAVRVNNLGSSQSLKKTKINPITTRRDLHVKEIFVSEEYQLTEENSQNSQDVDRKSPSQYN